MNFKIKTFFSIKSNKIFYTDFYFFLKKKLIILIKNIFPEYFNFNNKYKNWNLICLYDLLYFKVNNINFLDNVQYINSLIKIFLPLKFQNLKTNKVFFKNLLIFELPKYNSYNYCYLNGLKKIFISKYFTSNGIFFNKYLKRKYNIYYAKLLLTNSNFFNIILDLKLKQIYLSIKNLKFNFILFLYYLGIKNTDILKYSRYKNSKILKLLIFSALQTDLVNNKKIILKNLNYLKSIFKLTILNKNYKNFIISKDKLNYNYGDFSKNNLLIIDFIFILDLLLDLQSKKLCFKTIDHLDNKHINTIGNYFQHNFKFYLKKFISIIPNLIKLQKFSLLKVYNFKELLILNPLIQYLEQINSFSELMHKYKLNNYNSFSKGILNLREICLNQLGKLCLIDTTEGINCGLVVSFAKHIRIYKKGIIQVYFSSIFKNKTKEFLNFKTSLDQELYLIQFNNINLRKIKYLMNVRLVYNKNNFRIKFFSNKKSILLEFTDLFSFTENLIPFIKYNDPARCLMGAKMQSQSVPLLNKKKSFVITGYEKEIITKSDTTIKALQEGIVLNASSLKIHIKDLFNREIVYYLSKYKKSNQNTIIHQKPLVWNGERVFTNQLLTQHQDIIDSEFAIGNNLLFYYGNFCGYDFEDAVIVSKRVLYQQLFSSLHMDIYEFNFCYNNENDIEFSTLEIPKQSYYIKKNLDSLGIIKEGEKILTGSILLTKIKVAKPTYTYKSIFKLIYSIFGKTIRNIKDNSLYIQTGKSGRVSKIELFLVNISSRHKYKTYNNSYLKCRIFICKQRFLTVGDKLCGRYGNKGILSYIAENADLPFLQNSFYPDIIVGALGIPSRMNLGQLFEALVGKISFSYNIRILPSFTTSSNLYFNYLKILIYNFLMFNNFKKGFNWLYNFNLPGKFIIRDGRTGVKLKSSVLCGVSRYSKLIHLIKDKLHFRTTGPYTEILQQPLKGKKNLGGQRFGEMEIWALEAFGASYNLKEILNYKSDDCFARNNLKEYLLFRNTELQNSTITESFRVILKEFNGLILNLELFLITDDLEENYLNLTINY
ncbi:RNA polymerase beta chain (apicoplast) [Toxoplasma gondii RH]|uniref:DNA-directed RNA polymerase subunit beta n=1 Tax=Toxoplasma gondii TaxID=5811 RepID=RPOB_TOXGO|nr:RNA polymerase beta chain [Toxoplasma gondii RH]Q9MTD3.1 RecName: Full=DNA-directed RNA polymerase subunit beta; AltName: Full=PEP; AltName: Full=Plastid-encoded RNA polymerase subunit beta; Short=RNA polymerase subunit beta [Toxoplasma gondii]AAD41152.1 RNA polymerase B [Toxoplasma gondii]|eukprot:NP_044569.1 RNA polymerase beta chain (apicoplast) [Toxoplasma gondii RH]